MGNSKKIGDKISIQLQKNDKEIIEFLNKQDSISVAVKTCINDYIKANGTGKIPNIILRLPK